MAAPSRRVTFAVPPLDPSQLKDADEELKTPPSALTSLIPVSPLHLPSPMIQRSIDMLTSPARARAEQLYKEFQEKASENDREAMRAFLNKQNKNALEGLRTDLIEHGDVEGLQVLQQYGDEALFEGDILKASICIATSSVQEKCLHFLLLYSLRTGEYLSEVPFFGLSGISSNPRIQAMFKEYASRNRIKKYWKEERAKLCSTENGQAPSLSSR